jgi:hypothetical protein
MKNKKKYTVRSRRTNHGFERLTQSQQEETSKEKQDIKDYDRAWEDDRL